MVEPDRGGQDQQPCANAGPEPFRGAGTVAFQREQILEGLEHRRDPLSDPAQVGTAAGRFVQPARPDHRAADRGDLPLEGSADIALVADDDLAAAKTARQQLQGDLPLLLVGASELGPAWGAVHRADQVQAHAPEKPRVAAAVAVAGALAKAGATDRLQRAGALDRGRVQQHEVVVVAGAAAGEHPASQSMLSRSARRRLR